MIDLKKLSIYHTYEGAPDSPELYIERSEKWLNKEISLEEFITISKLDELCFCVRSGGYSSKMVEKMEMEINEIKKNVSKEVYEYLSVGKKAEFIEKEKVTWIKKLVGKIKTHYNTV
jgi:hypothetical protein